MKSYTTDWDDVATWVLATLFFLDRPLVAIGAIVGCYVVNKVTRWIFGSSEPGGECDD